MFLSDLKYLLPLYNPFFKCSYGNTFDFIEKY